MNQAKDPDTIKNGLASIMQSRAVKFKADCDTGLYELYAADIPQGNQAALYSAGDSVKLIDGCGDNRVFTIDDVTDENGWISYGLMPRDGKGKGIFARQDDLISVTD